jgi:hypothetical protein
MKTGEEKSEAEKQHGRGITEIPRGNNYAVFGSDMLLPLERALKFPLLPSGRDLKPALESCPRLILSGRLDRG